MKIFCSKKLKKELSDAQLEIQNLKASIEKIESENKFLRKTNSDLEDTNSDVVIDLKNLEAQKKELEYYRDAFYRLYIFEGVDGVPSETVRFASACFHKWNGLELFNPYRYIKDEGYRRTIDVNAEGMNRMFRTPRENPIPDTYSEAVREIGTFLTEKLKVAKTSAPAKERKEIAKLDLE